MGLSGMHRDRPWITFRITLGERGLEPYIWTAMAEKQPVHWPGGLKQKPNRPPWC
jgi:hypothetical protein